MKTIFVSLLFLLANTTISLGQVKLEQTIEKCEILGLSKLDDGALLLSTGDSKNAITCRKIATTGNVVWETLISIPNLGGYNFNMLQIFYDSISIFVTQQLDNETIIAKLEKSTGEIIYDNDRLKTKGGEEPLVWVAYDGSINLVSAENGLVFMQKNDEGKLAKDEEIIAFPDQFSDNKTRVFFSRLSTVFAGAYVLEPNHGKMHLMVSSYNLATGKKIEQEIELELEHTSFTYNSQFDLNVFGVVKGNTGFYLMGKLDYHFNKPYPTTKMGDNHIGFWIAKFDFDLNLVYMSELPYQYFVGLVPADMIQKPAVIDVKEDANKGLFININEQQGVIYGNKYLIYLDSTGMYRSVIGGKDDYNVLEYDKMGLRNAGRSSRIRLMNGHWSPYVTNTFLFTNNRPQDHSVQAENLISLVKKNKRLNPQTWSYNFLIFKENSLYFEYNDKQIGTLNIYSDLAN
jgi:hypothetical protein